MSPLGGGPSLPPEPVDVGPRSDEGIRAGKVLNFLFCLFMVLVCVAVDGYLVLNYRITQMMGLFALLIPCCIVLFATWTRSDTRDYMQQTLHRRDNHHSHRPGDIRLSFLLDIPVKLFDLMMSDDGIIWIFLLFVAPFGIMTALFWHYPHPSDYPNPINKLFRTYPITFLKLFSRRRRRY